MKNPTKLWLLMLTSAIVSLSIFFYLIILSGKLGNRGYSLDQLQEIAEDITKGAEHTSGAAAEVVPILELAHEQHPKITFELVSVDGVTIHDTEGTPTNYSFEQLADRLIGMPQNLWAEDESITLAYQILQDEQPYYLLLGLSSQAMKEGQVYLFVRTYRIILTILIPLIIAFLIPYLFSLWFFFSMNKRINKLNYAMGQLNLKSEVILLKNTKNDEIGQIIAHYNAMAQRIQNQTEQIKQFNERRRLLLSNLSHDLRTPLTMILGYAETIRTGLYKDERELQASAKVLLQRSRYMNKLLDQLLDISKQEDEGFELCLEECNVSELLRKIAADYIMFLEGQQFNVEITIPDEDIIASIDAALIERAVHNLIDNAIRYGAEGNYLEIKLAQRDGQLVIWIIDKGNGIPLEDQALVFNRFYRVNNSRKGEGMGIGLSIVKEIVEFHGGSITLSSVPSNTIFEIQLPLKQQNELDSEE